MTRAAQKETVRWAKRVERSAVSEPTRMFFHYARPWSTRETVAQRARLASRLVAYHVQPDSLALDILSAALICEDRAGPICHGGFIINDKVRAKRNRTVG